MKLDIFVNESKSIPNNIVGMSCVEEVFFMIPDSSPILVGTSLWDSNFNTLPG